MKKKKKQVCYVVFYRFIGKGCKIYKAIVKGDKDKITSKEKAIEIFRETYSKENPTKEKILSIIGSRVNTTGVDL